jgi:hypothetical protein
MATLSFYTVIDCLWRSFLRDVHRNLAVIAVIFCPNDSVAPWLGGAGELGGRRGAAAGAAAGILEGLLSFFLPILVYMGYQYRGNK